MSHRWEYEDEYFQLMDDMKHAEKEGNTALYGQLQVRMAELDAIKWRSKTARFTDLAPYQTVVEALEQMAVKLGVPFPNLTSPHNRTTDGQFIFGISDGIRTVQIWPLESRGYYDIEVYELGQCYKGQTTSLSEATLVLSRWFVERCTIDALHAEFGWMSREPFQLSGPRMTFG